MEHTLSTLPKDILTLILYYIGRAAKDINVLSKVCKLFYYTLRNSITEIDSSMYVVGEWLDKFTLLRILYVASMKAAAKIPLLSRSRIEKLYIANKIWSCRDYYPNITIKSNGICFMQIDTTSGIYCDCRKTAKSRCILAIAYEDDMCW